MEWELLKKPTEIRKFLCLAGYYRQFIEGFSTIAIPLTKLTRKIEKFIQTELQQHAFLHLKKVLYEAPILALLQGGGDFVVVLTL